MDKLWTKSGNGLSLDKHRTWKKLRMKDYPKEAVFKAWTKYRQTVDMDKLWTKPVSVGSPIARPLPAHGSPNTRSISGHR